MPCSSTASPNAGATCCATSSGCSCRSSSNMHAQFIQHSDSAASISAAFADPGNFLSWGHLRCSPTSPRLQVGNVRQIAPGAAIPMTGCSRRARFFVSDEFERFRVPARKATLSVECNSQHDDPRDSRQGAASLALFTYNAVAWLGTESISCRYEDLDPRAARRCRECRGRVFTELSSVRDRAAGRLAQARPRGCTTASKAARRRENLDGHRCRCCPRNCPTSSIGERTSCHPVSSSDRSPLSVCPGVAGALPAQRRGRELSSRRAGLAREQPRIDPFGLERSAPSVRRSAYRTGSLVSARAANQPWRVISSSSWPSPQPA